MDHLEKTKGFHLGGLSFLVMDEADRILNMDFEAEVDKILRVIPKEGRRTYLFSATMTKKVAKLQRASLKDPVKVEVSSKYQTVEKLAQHYLFIPAKHKVPYHCCRSRWSLLSQFDFVGRLPGVPGELAEGPLCHRLRRHLRCHSSGFKLSLTVLS